MSYSSIDNSSKLTNLQLEFLKSLKYMTNEKQLSEVKSLLRFYFASQLDSAIEKKEEEMGYTASVYENWLKNSGSKATK